MGKATRDNLSFILKSFICVFLPSFVPFFLLPYDLHYDFDRVVTYMVMDDLVVKPMSTISCVTLLNRFNVKDVGVLEEKVVDLGIDEVCQSIILWFLCMSPLIITVFIFSFYFPFFRHGEIYCEITLN